MPAPTSYTESQLKIYMYEHTKQTCLAVGLTSADFEEAVWDTFISYGVDAIGDATDIAKLRALAKVEAWRKCVQATAGKYDISRDSGQSSVWDKENQLHTNAVKQLELARADAMEAGYVADGSGSNTISLGTLVHTDAYSVEDEDDE